MEEPTIKRSDTVEFTAFGVTAKIPTRFLQAFLISLAGFLALGYMIRDHDLRESATLADARGERMLQIKHIEEAQTSLQDSMDTMVYVLSLSQEDRSKLKLVMPGALRSRLLNDERNR